MLLGVFLLGGTLGGVVFGSLADRFGRKPTMAATILCYSVFSGLTYFATEVWQVAACVPGGAGRGGRMGRGGGVRGRSLSDARSRMPRASFTQRAFSAPGWPRSPAWW